MGLGLAADAGLAGWCASRRGYGNAPDGSQHQPMTGVDPPKPSLQLGFMASQCPRLMLNATRTLNTDLTRTLPI